MSKKLINFLFFFSPLLMQAQITVNVILPPAGMVQKDQLWNLALVNNYNTQFEINILFTLQDAVTGQSVLSAGTRSISLGKGLKVLQARDVQPVQYNHAAAGFTGNFLPLGSYLACYTISRIQGDGTETLANECVRLNISPLSPPLLNTPADKSVINSTYPQFTWLPPTPLDMFDNLQYDISVAEVMPGQSPAEAILYNTPKYVSGRLKLPYESYPSTYTKLEAGKTYSWQVTARNGDSYAAATEVWTFRVVNDSVQQTTAVASYIQLKNKQERSGINYITGKELHIKYYAYDPNRTTAIRILDRNKAVLLEQKRDLVYGDNFISLKLDNRFHKGQVYQVEITDLNNNTYTAAFGIQ
ncbi:hypothetical protein HB364_26885 [Pseudoflavitalea sp. X16]|uniref:hypothetical protein n=1 Tax=Paraflavitalea devenefica TaxID=2716334 RepID=UPI00141FFAEE|nr:hypothetical protein [Paraflavitalea devenefica]NII28736.1 hypothetical protein [Paraflavitalea devenefica]